MSLRTQFHSDKPRLPALRAFPRSARLLALALAAATLVAACSPDASTHTESPQEMAADQAATAAASGAGQHEGMALERRGRSRAMLEEAVSGKAVAARPLAAPAPMAASAPMMDAASPASAAPSQRFLAVSHSMQIESPAAELASLWETVKSTCERLDCNVEGWYEWCPAAVCCVPPHPADPKSERTRHFDHVSTTVVTPAVNTALLAESQPRSMN